MQTGEMAKRVNRPPATIRWWCDRYSEFLSPMAVGRKKGARRIFNERDALVMATIATLADQGLQTTDIEEALRDDQLVDFLPDLPSKEEEAARRELSLVPVQQLQAAMTQVRYLEDERERLLENLEESQERVVELSREIGRLEGEITALRKQAERKGLFRR